MTSHLAAARLRALQRCLKQTHQDGYLTLSRLEQRYVSGVELSDGEAVFVITPKRAYCVTKKLILAKLAPARSFVTAREVPFGTMLEGALALIKEEGLRRVTFDPGLVPFSQGQALLAGGLRQSSSPLRAMRMQKCSDEISRLTKACRIAAQAFKEVKPLIKTGMSEEDVRVLMALAMTKRGAASIPFNIVCFGENTADAHHTPSKTRKLKNNEAVLMDFGCFYEGYTSDMTRSWWHGNQAPAAYTQIWNLVKKARLAGVKTLRAGVQAGAVDQAARTVITQAGYGKEFFHTTGHGIGLEEHDLPILRTGDTTPLQKNFVVTVEPGIYFAGRWGIRLEDSYLVTQTGSKKLT